VVEAELSKERCVFGDDALTLLFTVRRRQGSAETKRNIVWG
jgi:hypothetical protein